MKPEIIGLISCGTKKRKGKHPAAVLYYGNLFLKQKRFIEKHCKRWMIISAKYGPIWPDELIEPYAICVSKRPTGTVKPDPNTHYLTPKEAREWAQSTNRRLHELFDTRKIIFLSLLSSGYRSALKGFRILDPLKGLGLGERMQWLKQQMQTR